MAFWVLVGAFGVVVALVGTVLAVGSSLPASHEITRSATIPAAPEAVWKVISDFPAQPSWRPSVRHVEAVTSWGGDVWREEAGGDPIDFRTLKSEPPKRLVRAIVGDDLPFSGRWEIGIEPKPVDQCEVTVVERGEIFHPIFRFVARYVFGHARSAETYLNDLARKFKAAEPFG